MKYNWKRYLVITGIAFGLFLVVAVSMSLQMVVITSRKGTPTPFIEAFKMEGPFWLVWAVLSPLIYRFCQRLPLDNLRWKLLWHVPGSIFFTMCHLTIYIGIIYMLGDTDVRPFPPLKDFMLLLAKLNYAFRFWNYILVVVVAYAIDYYGRYQAGRMRAAELETHLAHAQLQALKMQLQPHFLFNTLNSISALLRKDVELADRMIARLGDFLRLTLESAGTQEVSLEQELDFLKSYLEIEAIRFHDRFEVTYKIDPRAREVQVPNLILQPIVENAIRHGVSNVEGPARIEIRAECRDHRLRLEVQDNGPGVTETREGEPEFREGLGIKNTRRRLERLYGDAQSLQLTNASGGGAIATLVLPLGD